MPHIERVAANATLLTSNAAGPAPVISAFAASLASPTAAATTGGPAAFPLKLSANNRYLVDQNNTPFLINQASSWGLIQSLSTADAIDYLDALKARGFNAVMVSIISFDVRMAGNPPNWQGISPFKTQWDYSTFNEAYFAHADEIINLAKDRGMLVTLVPSYLGYPGEPTQGWFDEMLSANNSVAKSQAYGQFLGRRYKDFTNIIWIAGGDNTPAPGSELEKRLKAIIDGIRETDTHLWTGHWDSVAHGNGVLSTDNPTFASYMNINGYYAYDYDFTFQRDLEAYNRTPAMMLFHLDQSYETEPGGTPSNIRRKAYQAMLTGAAGSSFAAGPTWVTFTNWRSTMDTPAGLQNQIWLQAFKSRPWFDLVPDQNHLTVTSGLGQLNSVTYLTAARTPSGSTVMAYLFDERPVTIDMSRVSGTQAKAWWFSPLTGQSTLIGTFPTTGSKVFTTPTIDDWLLVLDDASLNLPAPGVAGPAAVAVSLLPSSTNVTTEATRQFTASVTGSSNTAVTWSIQEGVTGGAVDTLGVYTAPATPGTYHVVATSIADSSKSASSTVTVTAPIPVVVAVSLTPISATVTTGATRQFTASVTGSSNTAVTSSIQEGSTGGTVTANGLYTAPAAAGTFHVVATSSADTTKSASAAITVSPSGGGSNSIAAMPLISRNKPAYVSSLAIAVSASAANDANHESMWVPSSLPAWIAYDLSTVPVEQRQQVLVAWYAPRALGYIYPSPEPFLQMPVDYTIETNMAPGGTGSAPITGWQVAVTVTGNNRGSREHLFNLAGANWIRLVATAGSDPASIAIDLDVHSAPEGASDAWLFLGDSNTGIVAYLFSDLPALVNGLAPNRWPVIVPAGIGGTNVFSANDTIDASLSTFPGRYVTLNYGTNLGFQGFGEAMEVLIGKVHAAGKIPVIPHMPWSTLPEWQVKGPIINAVIDALYLKYPDIVHGPNLWDSLAGHPEWMADNDIHPSPLGAEEMRRLWAVAMTANSINPPVTPPATVAVSLTPSTASVTTGTTSQFAASVTGSSITAVTWSVQEGSIGGTVSASGLYTAPATAGTFHVKAVSVADNTKSATATITVIAPTPPPIVAVSVTPSTASVTTGAASQFTASVTGSSNTAVTWSIQEGSTGGAVSASGLYTAPAMPGTFHVVATSNADTTKSATGTIAVTITPVTPPVPTASWINVTSNLAGLSSDCGTLSFLSSKPDQDMLIASISQQGYWASTDGATTWFRLGTGAGSPTIGHKGTSIVYDPVAPTTFWESGIFGELRSYKTTDNGRTFRAFPFTGTPSGVAYPYHNDSISVDLTDPARKTILLGSHEGAKIVLRSTDSGQTWVNVGANIPSALLAGNVLVLDAQTYLVGCNNNDSAAIFRTTNAGATWTKVSDNGGIDLPLHASDGRIYWLARDGMVRSDDQGATWTTLATGNVLKFLPAFYAPPPIELPNGKIATLGNKNEILISADFGATWNAATTPLPFTRGFSNPQLTYSRFRKAFFFSNASCDNQVPADAVLRYGYDATSAIPTPPPVVAVSLTPSTASVAVGATRQFTASVTGSSNSAVTWSIQEGSTGGTISANGLYTAPATAGIFRVVATSTADNTKSATAIITVTAPIPVPVVAVSLTPSTASVTTGATSQFTASVTGSSNPAVIWGIQEGSTGGTISANGLYTAPATTGIFHVVVTSAADNTKSVTATITVTAPIPVVAGVNLSPTSVSAVTGATRQFTATVTGLTNTTVVWSVLEGSAGGTVSSSGLYSAPAIAGTYHVKAISVADNTKSATATITVTLATTPLKVAPVLRIKRDDRSAILDMDYNADNPWGQWWAMTGSGKDDAGFLVTWWPDGASPTAMGSMGGCTGCAGACGNPTDPMAVSKSLVTANRRVQLQPLVNGGIYHVCVERINSLGEITSQRTELTFNGGDDARVDALRASLTFFDDFNLPMGAADEKLWNAAASTETDSRLNLFFVNDQFHAHSLNGTVRGGGKSQTAQRFRKPIAIENGVRRHVFFDMDSPLSSRSVWYLDFNPVKLDLTGHADFFDEEGVKGLPAGLLRLRSQFQQFSVSLIGADGASHLIGVADMQSLGVQAVSNVRRNFEARVGTDGIEILVDGKSIINAPFPAGALKPGAYELLWNAFGYNTSKDNVPYYLVHWDNFGFDGPNLESRAVHNYVTRIAGTDYQKASRANSSYPTFTVKIPDDLRPIVNGAAAEAWLVFTYQSGDYSSVNLLPNDYLLVNGGAKITLPAIPNNTSPLDPSLLSYDKPYTVRVKLGDLVKAGASPLLVGDNTFKFYADNAGIVDLHVEVFYPQASEPTYTPPAAIHPFPMHADVPKLGPPARFEMIAGTEINRFTYHVDDPAILTVPVSGVAPVMVVVGNESYAGWAPNLMVFPAQSQEIWGTGGVAGISTVELFLRRVGTGTGPGDRVAQLSTFRDAPAPQGRYALQFDTRAYPNGDYELFVLATTPTGVKSHPTYQGAVEGIDVGQLSGAYYPIHLKIQN